MKPRLFLMILMGLAFLSTSGCAGTKVKRVPVEKTVDLSGRWNDTDSRLVSEEMILDSLKRPWINHFVEKTQKDPVIIVGSVANRSHEHIDAQVFTKDLEQSLLNSGKVKIVASSQERLGVREERGAQQEGYTDPDTIKARGKELGADFMLIGSINSIKDEAKGKYAILYQVNLELVDLTSNEKVWIGQKELKKIVEKSKFSL